MIRNRYTSLINSREYQAATCNEEARQSANNRLAEIGAIDGKGKPNEEFITEHAQNNGQSFIRRYIAYFGGTDEALTAVNTLLDMYDNEQYIAMYFYLAILYGQIDWRVPGLLSCLPVNMDGLIIYLDIFLNTAKGCIDEQEDMSK